ncbi:MAG: CCA tRNA nucleotidyltransferase [Pseudomonadota bacterium]|nr:CCA tRNA nucleotidyltransferase [Pseudomonadota bacterium]
MSRLDAAKLSLAGAAWLETDATQRVFRALGKSGYTVRAVGGSVRNALLGLDVTEIDLATDAPPEDVMQLAKAAGLKTVPTGIEHGTVTVLSGGSPYEVTTLRRDVETFGRKATVAFTDDWTEDAGRRDFTMNALYADADGTIHDPIGGLDDLRAGRVRFIGDPHARIREDYLRILRFFRFNARFGAPPYDAAALSACVRERGGLARLSAERVRMELLKLLVAGGAVDALESMFDHGLRVEVLGGAPLLARLKRLIGIEAAAKEPACALRRLAALAVFVPEDADRLGERLRLSNKEQAMLHAAARWRQFLPRPQEAQAKILLYRMGSDSYRRAAMQAWASSGAPAGDVGWLALVGLPARWIAPEFPLRGADITSLGVAKGPRVGAVLAEVESRWIESGMRASRDELLRQAEKAVAEKGGKT